MVAIGYVGLACKNAGGFPTRSIIKSNTSITHGDIDHSNFDDYYSSNFFPCKSESIRSKSKVTGNMVRCFETKQSGKIDLYLIGDSHADHLLAGLSQSFPSLNIALYTRNDLPFIDSDQYDEIFHELLANQAIKKTVIISSMWAVAPLDYYQKKKFKHALTKTIDILVSKGWFIYLTDDTPKFGFDSARCKFNNPFTGKNQCSEDSNFYFSIRSSYLPILREVYFSRPSNVGFIDLSNSFCTGDYCFMGKNNAIYFRDNNHLNILGSSIVGKSIREQIGVCLLQ
jgi:hypothetical protein